MRLTPDQRINALSRDAARALAAICDHRTPDCPPAVLNELESAGVVVNHGRIAKFSVGGGPVERMSGGTSRTGAGQAANSKAGGYGVPFEIRTAFQRRVARDKQFGQWITIGGGDKSGGTPVYIEDGKITKGPDAVSGKSLNDVDRNVAGTVKDKRQPPPRQGGKPSAGQAPNSNQRPSGAPAQNSGLAPKQKPADGPGQQRPQSGGQGQMTREQVMAISKSQVQYGKRGLGDQDSLHAARIEHMGADEAIRRHRDDLIRQGESAVDAEREAKREVGRVQKMVDTIKRSGANGAQNFGDPRAMKPQGKPGSPMEQTQSRAKRQVELGNAGLSDADATNRAALEHDGWDKAVENRTREIVKTNGERAGDARRMAEQEMTRAYILGEHASRAQAAGTKQNQPSHSQAPAGKPATKPAGNAPAKRGAKPGASPVSKPAAKPSAKPAPQQRTGQGQDPRTTDPMVHPRKPQPKTGVNPSAKPKPRPF